MAEQTKTFAFATTAEGFSGTPGSVDSSLSYDSGTGNPAGALKSRIFGRNKGPDANYWEWSGTWEDLGITPGATVTKLRINGGYTKCTEFNVADPSSVGPYELRNSGGTLQATLWSGRSITGTDGDWVSISAQADQDVPSEMQASNTTIKLRLNNTLDNGNDASAAVTVYDDQIVFVVTYSAGITGSLDVTLDDATLSGAGEVNIEGSTSATLEDAACAAGGTVDVEGQLSKTLDDATCSGSAEVDISGSLSKTLDDATCVADGDVEIEGSLDATLEDATLDASGTVGTPPIEGSLDVTLADATLEGQGTVEVLGSLDASLQDATCSAAGNVDIAGALDVALEDASCAASGEVAIAGAASLALEDATLSAQAEVSIGGTLAADLEAATALGTGEVAIQGQLATTLADALFSGVGQVVIAGALEATLEDATLQASGVAGTEAEPRTAIIHERNFRAVMKKRSFSVSVEDRDL